MVRGDREGDEAEVRCLVEDDVLLGWVHSDGEPAVQLALGYDRPRDPIEVLVEGAVEALAVAAEGYGRISVVRVDLDPPPCPAQPEDVGGTERVVPVVAVE